jgi:hypothetical protein
LDSEIIVDPEVTCDPEISSTCDDFKPSLTIVSAPDNGVEYLIDHGTIVEARRYYYGSAEPRPIIAIAAWRTRALEDDDGNPSTPRHVIFPDGNTWVVEGVSIAVRKTAPPQTTFTFGDDNDAITQAYEVVVIDRDSDGDGILNESGPFGIDTLPIVVWHHGESATTSTQTRIELTRDMLGRIIKQQEFSGGAAFTDDRFLYNDVDGGTNVRLRYRLNEKQAFGFPAIPSDPSPTVRRLWKLCTSLSALSVVGAEGDVRCAELPNTPNSLRVTRTSSRSSSHDGARLLVDAFQEVSPDGHATTLLTSFQRVTSGGFLAEAGIGDGVFGGGDDGNYVRYMMSNLSTAAVVATQVAKIQVRSGKTPTVILGSKTLGYDQFGRVNQMQTFTGDGTALIAQKNWSGFDADGRPATQVEKADFGGVALNLTTSVVYDAAGRVKQVNEADGNVAKYRFNNGVTPKTGRLESVRRGTSSTTTTTMLDLERNSDGDLIGASSNSTTNEIAAYDVDGYGRLTNEILSSAGMQRTYAYNAWGGMTSRSTKLAEGTTVRSEVRSFDHLRRLTQIDFAPSGAAITQAWDFKENVFVHEGATACVVNGRSINLSNKNQRLRLAWTSDEAGADFFEYDALGRVIAKIRHDGSLANGFACAKLRETEYTYLSAGELSEIRYPSGRIITYQYADDRSHPDSIQVSASTSGASPTTIVSHITYDGLGRVRTWQWAAGSTLW